MGSKRPWQPVDIPFCAGPLRILLVEDDALVAWGLESMLVEIGHSPEWTAGSAEEAIEAAATHHPDLVIMDIRLRGDRDGIDAAREIVARYSIPVLFLTGYSDPRTLRRAKEARSLGVLTKPTFPGELWAALAGAGAIIAQGKACTPDSKPPPLEIWQAQEP